MVSENKKRYYLSLTQEAVEDFQDLAKSMGMPSNVMSLVCDDAIKQTAELFRMAKEKGTFTITDMFTLIGKQMEEFSEFEKNNITK